MCKHPTHGSVADAYPFHLFWAAFLAISAHLAGVIRAARPPPPREPSSAAADFAESISSASSPVAMRMTLTDMPITSAGRFSPRGPRGIYNRPHRFRLPVLALLLTAFWMRSGFLVGV